MPTIHPQARHDHTTFKFPKDFLWGSATSAYQVEGGNNNSDWGDKAGIACDQYNLYPTDFDLAKSLNQNAHRLSIEWSRIEPKDGEFDRHEIEHYINELKYLKSLNIKVMLTLWHFTLPKWVAERGGWENGETVVLFERFIKKVIPEFVEYVDFWITLNEPGVYVYEIYLAREWPGAKKSFLGQIKTTLNLSRAHKKIYKFLHEVSKSPVGLANNIQSFEPYHKHSIIEMLTVSFYDIITNHLFYYLTKGTHDFLGINYYFHTRFKDGKGILPEIADATELTHDISDLGWEVYPEGLFDVLTDLSDHIPIYITECGIASTNDDRRNRFLITYLQEVYRAIEAGIDIRGFFYWSLIDNFEWQKGFDPRFGLIEVDYDTQKRHARPSAEVYAEIARVNGIPHKLLRFIGHTIRAKDVLKAVKR